jgi:hypothetical protein
MDKIIMKNPQEIISTKKLRNKAANVTTKDGEAFVCVTKTKDEKVGLSWKGTKQDLLNLLFTACRNDKQMAALICRAAKDHIDYCNGTHQDWVNLTADIVQLDQELDTNQHQEGGNA